MPPRTRRTPGTECMSDCRWKHQAGLRNWFSKVVTVETRDEAKEGQRCVRYM